MKDVYNIITFATAYLVLYVTGAQLGVLPAWVLVLLFLGSPVLVIYMVIRILKDDYSPDGTFDEGYWYEDKDRIESVR